MAIQILVPSPGESVTEVEIGDWLIENGAQVEMDDELVEINSDKATLTVAAEEDGIVHIKVKAGTVVNVGDVIGTIEPGAGVAKPKKEEKAAPAEQKAAPAPEKAGSSSYAAGVPSVSAAKMMEEKNLAAGDVQGTGRGGRITKTDVVQHKDAPKTAASSENGSHKAAEAAPAAFSGSRNTERKRMSTLRRKIADRLVSAKNDTAMLTTFNEVDMQNIMELRSKYKEKFKEVHGVGLGFMSFFTKACTEAIKHFPNINAQLDGEDLITFDYVDMGFAVSTPRGLVVPVLRNVEQMSLNEIESGIREVAIKARDGKITLQDMTGGTFTITNGGVFGSMLSTPILNPPQSAILGMHNIVQRPVAIDGQVVIRPIMYVALSYDHRVVDGKESVSFLFKVKELLEDPARLLLGF